MSGRLTRKQLQDAYRIARERLLFEKGALDHWRGELSPSALSTATAVSALWSASPESHGERAAKGLDWLLRTQNADGGWGDTPSSKSNLPTTCLVLAAFAIAGRRAQRPLERAWDYVRKGGGVGEVVAIYGGDRTFSAPILTNLAIAGLARWEECPPLPFHLAALPPAAYPYLGLRVVSYALPALIAVGLAQFTKTKLGNRWGRALRRAAVPRALRRLLAVTPRSGGYLEATPITSFVAMSLIAAGKGGHPVAEENVRFLCAQQRGDGAWKIERDLAVWLTTLSVKALGEGDAATRDWLLRRQSRGTHPYVGSPAGAWGWTDADGSVPDADDTSGALLALKLMPVTRGIARAALRGARWLLDLQNRDGGWPTFCRGWQKLPFDRSCPDITAHALRAIAAWRDAAEPRPARRMEGAMAQGFAYLESSQRPDGAWTPLWFGNENAPDQANLTYGTSRVLMAYGALGRENTAPARQGVRFLRDSQNADGTWGGAPKVQGSLEETALACEALCAFPGPERGEALDAGLAALCRGIAGDGFSRPAPIGLYFAKLWYFERLYPIIFSVAALRRAMEDKTRPSA